MAGRHVIVLAVALVVGNVYGKGGIIVVAQDNNHNTTRDSEPGSLKGNVGTPSPPPLIRTLQQGTSTTMVEKGLEWVARSYGKQSVKLLYVRREGDLHTIQEYEVDTELIPSSDKGYVIGDNSDVVATDTQKNTVYILAKEHGLSSPEDFALILTEHFLKKYSQITAVSVRVRVQPWQRQIVDGRAHKHAFVFAPAVERSCKVSRKRHELPEVWTELEGLRLLKTTQSSFAKFVKDEFTLLPDMEDRILSTTISASWRYNNSKNIDYENTWKTVIKVITDNFSGPADTGIYSPSLQNTLYKIIRNVLVQAPEVSQVKMAMPNNHYFPFDMSKFPHLRSEVNNEVFLPLDKPFGMITGTLGRI